MWMEATALYLQKRTLAGPPPPLGIKKPTLHGWFDLGFDRCTDVWPPPNRALHGQPLVQEQQRITAVCMSGVPAVPVACGEVGGLVPLVARCFLCALPRPRQWHAPATQQHVRHSSMRSAADSSRVKLLPGRAPSN